MNTIKVYFWDTSEKSNNDIRNNYDSDELNITEREFNISLDLIDQPIKAIAIDRYFHELDGILLHRYYSLALPLSWHLSQNGIVAYNAHHKLRSALVKYFIDKGTQYTKK